MANIIFGGEENENYLENSKSFGELLLAKLTGAGKNKVAFINGKTGDSITFAELKARSMEMAVCLHNFGVRQHDIVAIIVGNSFDFLYLSFGAMFIGAIAAPLSQLYKEFEMQHCFQILRPKFVFVSGYAAELVTKFSPIFNFKVICLNNEIFSKFLKEKNIDNIDKIFPSNINVCSDVAVILNSSGTTGLPKGVQLTHLNLMASTTSLKNINGDIRRQSKFSDETVSTYLGVTPWTHVMGILTCLWTIFYSERLVFLDRFEPEVYLKCIQDYKVDFTISVPTLMVFLCKTNLFEKYDLSSLKEIICGAATVSKELEEAIKERFNGKLITRQIYGMTESLGLITYQRDVFKSGSVGSVIRGTLVKIVGSNGEILGPNERGEICTKSVQVMKGYVGDENATRDTIDEEGWLHTGDMGYYDEDHQFFMIERIKELIKYNAFQVPPAEIESLLITHPKVKDTGVVGIPDPQTGEKARAFIVKQPNVEITETEIIEFVAKNLSKPKQLHGGVQFIDAIPKTSTGKILRRVLLEMYD